MLFAIVGALPAGAIVPAAIAQQQEEDETSLDEEDLAGEIVSDMLDDTEDEEEDWKNDNDYGLRVKGNGIFDII